MVQPHLSSFKLQLLLCICRKYCNTFFYHIRREQEQQIGKPWEGFGWIFGCTLFLKIPKLVAASLFIYCKDLDTLQTIGRVIKYIFIFAFVFVVLQSGKHVAESQIKRNRDHTHICTVNMKLQTSAVQLSLVQFSIET